MNTLVDNFLFFFLLGILHIEVKKKILVHHIVLRTLKNLFLNPSNLTLFTHLPSNTCAQTV